MRQARKFGHHQGRRPAGGNAVELSIVLKKSPKLYWDLKMSNVIADIAVLLNQYSIGGGEVG
jgi:hypothetical protein